MLSEFFESESDESFEGAAEREEELAYEVLVNLLPTLVKVAKSALAVIP